MMMKLAIFCILSFVAFTNAGFTPQIVNGVRAKPGEIPYQVSLQNKDSNHHFCGGSILNEDYVITAAHCLTSKSPETIAVVVGTTDLNDPFAKHFVEKTIIHEKYNRTDSWINDIALIKVKTPFKKSQLISFVPLPTVDDVAKTGDIAVVSGFGRLWHNGDRTKFLHWVNVKVADQEYCKSMYKKSSHNIRPTHLCANDPQVEKGSCKGDSGGPLMVKGKLAGLVSWSRSCANTVYPSVYTRVVLYLDWIKKHAI